MIELQRARLLAAGGAAVPAPNSINATMNGSPAIHHATMTQQTPQQAAASALRQKDADMERFIQRLQTYEPTVPGALSRRMLHRNGVGYGDPTVAAVTSAAGDRFLAAVLQQALACRDQRLQGMVLARDTARQRKRHMEQYQADADDRQRRKLELAKQREKANLAAIEAAEALKKSGASPIATTEEKPKKKKKTEDAAVNGSRLKHLLRENGEDDASYDSLDEEEDYYQEYYGESGFNVNDEEEDDNDMLILRDVARPLEAWDFHVTGKEGMDPTLEEEVQEDEENYSDDEDEDDEGEEALGKALENDEIDEEEDEKSTKNIAVSRSNTPAPSGGTPSKK